MYVIGTQEYIKNNYTPLTLNITNITQLYYDTYKEIGLNVQRCKRILTYIVIAIL